MCTNFKSVFRVRTYGYLRFQYYRFRTHPNSSILYYYFNIIKHYYIYGNHDFVVVFLFRRWVVNIRIKFIPCVYLRGAALANDDCDSFDINFVPVFLRRYGIITDYTLLGRLRYCDVSRPLITSILCVRVYRYIK